MPVPHFGKAEPEYVEDLSQRVHCGDVMREEEIR